MLGWTAPDGIDSARLGLCNPAREPSDEDYQDWSGHRQACLSGAWGRRDRNSGVARAASARCGGEVLRQATAEPDRLGGVRRFAPLGAAIARARARGRAAAAAIHQALH